MRTLGIILGWVIGAYSLQWLFSATPDWHQAFVSAYQGAAAMVTYAATSVLWPKKG